MITPLLLISSLLADLSLPEHPNLTAAPPSAWVVEVQPEISTLSDSSQKEVQYLLFDRQVNLNTSETYVHRVMKVLDGGVQSASKVEIEFDPSYQELIIHKITAYRGEQKIKALTQESLRLIQREKLLEDHIYNGLLSFIALLSGIKSGDVVDISYTFKGEKPINSGYFDELRSFAFNTKIEKQHYRYLTDKHHPLHFKTFNFSSILQERVLEEALLETTVSISPSQVIEYSETPYWYFPHPMLQTSNFQSWQEVSKWGKALFEQDTRNALIEVKKIVKDWVAEDSKTQQELALLALRYVQNEIRYMGIEDGIYTHTPHDPLETLNKCYGDCKDKTVLLKVFMDALQIDSQPSLVSCQYFDKVKEFLPSASLFDHVILKVTIDGEDYWLDPTKKYQEGSLKEHSEEGYGCYLVLNGKEDSLHCHTAKFLKKSLNVFCHYHVTEEKCALDVVTTYSGALANSMRSEIGYYGTEAFSKSYKDYTSRLFGTVEINKELTITDDKVNNNLFVFESYFLPDLLEQGEFSSPAIAIPTYLPNKVSYSREHPLALDFPLDIQEIVMFSSDRPQEADEESVRFEHPAFVFTYNTSMHEQNLIFRLNYQAKADHILPKDFVSLKSTLSNINDYLSVRYTYNPTESDDENLTKEELFGVILFVLAIAGLIYGFYLVTK